MGRGQGLVEGKPDGLDGDIWRTRLLEKGSQNARRYVATSTDGNHQLRFEFFENTRSDFLAQLVDLGAGLSASAWRGSCVAKTYLVVGHILLDDHLE